MSTSTRYKLIALDNDLNTLREIAEIAAPYYETVKVRDVGRAIATCETDADVRVIVTEHVMHAATGASLLQLLRTRHPLIRRVMLTTYADLATIVDGLHSGSIQHLIRKPISRSELLAAIAPTGATAMGPTVVTTAGASLAPVAA